MSDTKNTGDKTLTVAPKTTLTLKRPVEQGMVRQSFSHGRSKAVVVEKVKTRVVTPAGKPAPAVTAKAPAAAPTPAAPTAPVAPRGPTVGAGAAPAASPAPQRAPTGVVLRTLTDEERDARARALVGARAREEEERRIAEAD